MNHRVSSRFDGIITLNKNDLNTTPVCQLVVYIQWRVASARLDSVLNCVNRPVLIFREPGTLPSSHETTERHVTERNAVKGYSGCTGSVEASSMASDSTTANVNGRESGNLNGEPVVKRPRESSAQEPPHSFLKEPQNKVTVVLGAQWGDEGKGKVVDLLAMDADIVCRCQVTNDTVALTFTFTAPIPVLYL